MTHWVKSDILDALLFVTGGCKNAAAPARWTVDETSTCFTLLDANEQKQKSLLVRRASSHGRAI